MSKQAVNNNLILICGESGSGKSASLRNLPEPEKVMFLNCEAGKKLPFRTKFKEFIITDPYQVYEGFTHAIANPDSFHTIIVDTSTFLMDMFVSKHIIGSKDTMKGWLMYAEFFRNLMQDYVASAPQNVIVLAHVKSELNEAAMTIERKVPVKGALGANGIEAFFSTVIATKKMTLADLADFDSDLLNITTKEKAKGFKHVFQTEITADTVNERVRGPMDMWEDNETFIDNDVNLVLKRLVEFHSEGE